MAQTFIQKWHGKSLPDAGAYVSKEYRQFQTALIKEIGRIAESIGAKLVSNIKGHYDTSCFIERDGKFVYIRHCSTLSRNMGCYVKVELDHILFRTAKSAKDYTGGTNRYCEFSDLKDEINRLLKH